MPSRKKFPCSQCLKIFSILRHNILLICFLAQLTPAIVLLVGTPVLVDCLPAELKCYQGEDLVYLVYCCVPRTLHRAIPK